MAKKGRRKQKNGKLAIEPVTSVPEEGIDATSKSATTDASVNTYTDATDMKPGSEHADRVAVPESLGAVPEFGSKLVADSATISRADSVGDGDTQIVRVAQEDEITAMTHQVIEDN